MFEYRDTKDPAILGQDTVSMQRKSKYLTRSFRAAQPKTGRRSRKRNTSKVKIKKTKANYEGVLTRSMLRTGVSRSGLVFSPASTKPTEDTCKCTVCEHTEDMQSSLAERILLTTAKMCSREFLHCHLLTLFDNFFERMYEICHFASLWCSPPSEDISSRDIDFLQAVHCERFTGILANYPEWESFAFRSPDLVVNISAGPVVCVLEFRDDSHTPDDLEELVLSTCGYNSRNTPASETLAVSIDHTWSASVYMSIIEDYTCKLIFIDKYNLLNGDSCCLFGRLLANFIKNVVNETEGIIVH